MRDVTYKRHRGQLPGETVYLTHDEAAFIHRMASNNTSAHLGLPKRIEDEAAAMRLRLKAKVRWAMFAPSPLD